MRQLKTYSVLLTVDGAMYSTNVRAASVADAQIRAKEEAADVYEAYPDDCEVMLVVKGK